MKVTASINTKTETLDVHFEIEDEAAAKAKLAQVLQDIQKRFCARTDTKTPTAARVPREMPTATQAPAKQS